MGSFMACLVPMYLHFSSKSSQKMKFSFASLFPPRPKLMLHIVWKAFIAVSCQASEPLFSSIAIHFLEKKLVKQKEAAQFYICTFFVYRCMGQLGISLNQAAYWWFTRSLQKAKFLKL